MPVYYLPNEQEVLKSVKDFPLENMSEEQFIRLIESILQFFKYERFKAFTARGILCVDGIVPYGNFVQNIVTFFLYNNFCRVYYNKNNNTYILFPHTSTDQDNELRESINSDLHYDDPEEGYTRETFKEIFKRVDREGNKISVKL